MADSVFDYETLLDISVNIIPMGIIFFFTVFLLFFSPFPRDVFSQIIAVGLHVIPFVLLGLLTYVAAQVIES